MKKETKTYSGRRRDRSRVVRTSPACPRASSQATEASSSKEQVYQLGLGDRSLITKSFDSFVTQFKELLEPTANEKGYNSTGVDGKNELFDFVQDLTGSRPYHALGEIIYKVKRYERKKDDKDLLKIAAWAYLIWKHGKK